MSTAPSYVRSLDGVRGLAVLAVIYHHWVNSGGIVSGGVLGVTTFFVLSGYLITRILLVSRFKEAGTLAAKMKRFYVRRTLRIFPLYYAVLLASAVVSPQFRALWPWYVAYLQNIRMMLAGKLLFASHLWTLAIEEQFYLAWPLFVLTLGRRALGWMLVLLVAAAPLWRLIAATALGLSPVQVWLFTLSSLDALALGALLAWLPSVGRTPSSGVLGGAGALGIALVAAQVFLTWELVLFRTGVALAAFAGIGWLVQNQSGRLARMLSFGPLVYIGRISYGIYVYHLFVPSKLGAFARLLIHTGNSWIFATGCFAVTVLVASVSWYFFEAPLNALKERWAAREVAVPAPAELQTP